MPDTTDHRPGRTHTSRTYPVIPPIYQTTTFVFENAQEVVAYNEGRSDKYLYSRYSNPTVAGVEHTLAVLDAAESALLCSSGMGAIATVLMAHTRSGDEVVCSASLYGGTLHLLNDLLDIVGGNLCAVGTTSIEDQLELAVLPRQEITGKVGRKAYQ